MLGHRVLLWGAVSGLGMLLCGVLVASLWDTLMAAIITAKLPLVPGSEVSHQALYRYIYLFVCNNSGNYSLNLPYSYLA